MIQAPDIVSMGDLLNNEVVNVAGDHLGTVRSYGIDIKHGRIAYVVLSFGGFLGFGDKWFAVPWDAMEFSSHDQKFILNMDRELLKTAPGFDKDNWPSTQNREFANQVYKFYERRPYWEVDES